MWRGLKKGLQSVDPMVDSWGRQWVDKMAVSMAVLMVASTALPMVVTTVLLLAVRSVGMKAVL